MKKNIHNLILSLGMFGPLVFFILMYIVFPLLYPGYNSGYQHISQLGAINSPINFYANFFGFYLFGICLILFSLSVFRLNKLTFGHKVSSILLLMTGVTVSLISFFPCDIGCHPVTSVGLTHLILAGVQLFFLVSSIIIFSLSKPLPGKLNKHIKIIFFLWLIPSLVWFSNILFDFHSESVGFIQRIAMAITYFFIVIQGFVYSQYYKSIDKK